MPHKRSLRAIYHAFELLLVLLVVFICANLGMSYREILAHAIFSIATISFVHCVDCCRVMMERLVFNFELCLELHRRGHAQKADEYRAHRQRILITCVAYIVATAITGSFWVASAILFARLLSQDGPEPQFFLGLCAATCLGLAAWKVWDVSAGPEHYDLGEVLDAFKVPGGGSTPQPSP